LKGEIEKNNNFSKRSKKKIEIKRIRTKLKIIIFDKLGLKDEIKKNKISIKGQRINIWNKKNKD